MPACWEEHEEAFPRSSLGACKTKVTSDRFGRTSHSVGLGRHPARLETVDLIGAAERGLSATGAVGRVLLPQSLDA
jgi:hypothetical protein